jgi:hypothetical protein
MRRFERNQRPIPPLHFSELPQTLR